MDWCRALAAVNELVAMTMFQSPWPFGVEPHDPQSGRVARRRVRAARVWRRHRAPCPVSRRHRGGLGEQ